MCKPVKIPPSDGAALDCGSTPAVAPVTLSESLALDTWPPRAAAAVIPPTRMAAATVTDNFRNPPSTPDTLFSNPMSLLPKIPGRSPWPGVLVRFRRKPNCVSVLMYLLVLHGSDCHLL